jgi:hypothetical protein
MVMIIWKSSVFITSKFCEILLMQTALSLKTLLIMEGQQVDEFLLVLWFPPPMNWQPQKGQKIQWQKKRTNNDLQNTTQKTKDRSTRIPLRCSWMVITSCSTCDTCCVNIVTNPVIGHDHEWGKNQIVIMTNRGNPIKVCFCQQKRMSPPVPQTVVKGKKSI